MGKTEIYKDEKIVASVWARLHSPLYPDNSCAVVLTEKHIFVLEDNYDGTYNEFYAFSIEDVEEVKISMPLFKSMDLKSNTNRTISEIQDIAHNNILDDISDSLVQNGIVTGPVIDAFTPVSKERKGGRKGSNIKEKYLDICFLDMDGKKDHLFFNDAGLTDYKKIINAFNKVKTNL